MENELHFLQLLPAAIAGHSPRQWDSEVERVQSDSLQATLRGSETVRFNVLKVIPAGSSSGASNAFTVIFDEFWFAFEVMYYDWIK
ncbi:hypothetical protein A2U01_0004175, partial [Trifolium medium]|nr:hypothetical protein [Trifolium medium]